MRRALLILSAFLVLSGFKMFVDGGIIDRWYFDSTSGLSSSSGIDVSISSASPPSVMVATPTSGAEPFFVTPSANDTEVGPYGLYAGSALENLFPRSSFETCDGSDHPVGWNVTEQGTGALECSSTRKSSGSQSVKVTCSDCGGAPAVHFSSPCLTINNSNDYIISYWRYGTSGDEEVVLVLYEYGTGDCSGGSLQGTTIENYTDIPESWSKKEFLMETTDWHASAASALLYFIFETDDGSVFYIDDIMVYESSDGYNEDSCHCDTDTTCSCSTIIPSIPTKVTAGTWQFEATVRSPVDGAVTTPERYIFYIPATAGDNNKVQFYWSNDLLTLNVWTNTGVLKTATVSTSSAGDADTSYTVRAYHTDTGRIGVCWNGTCGTEATGAYQETPSATTYIGSTDTVGSNIWVDDIVWSRKLLEAP